MKTIFTEHVKERMKKRRISSSEILEAINYPERILKKEGKYYAKKNIVRANIEVVYEKGNYIKVITIYYL